MIWLTVWSYVKKVFSNRIVQIVLVGLALLGLGYWYGRHVQPARVVTQEKVVTVTKDRIVYQDKIVEKVVRVKDKATQTHTQTVVVEKPDGTKTTTTVVDTSTKTTTNTDATKTEDKDKVADKDTSTSSNTVTKVEAQTFNWRLGVGAGVSIPTLLGEKEMGVPGLRGAVIQVEAERRIIGPIFMGLWGNTQGTVGVSASGVF